jgi:hypothetical protein
MDEGRFSVSAESLYQRLGGPAALLVIDVRRAAGFDADDKMIAGAIRRNSTRGAASCRPGARSSFTVRTGKR